jgi:hypothetical protein
LPPRSPTGTAAPATPISTPTSQSRTRCRPSTDAGCRSTAGCCSRPTWQPRTYNTALEQQLRETLGVRFAERPGTDPAKRPIREIVGVDPRLNQRWSTPPCPHRSPPRRAGHPIPARSWPATDPVEALHPAQQATLETRDAKQEPRSLAGQRATWLSEAAAVLGARRPSPRWCARRSHRLLRPPGLSTHTGSRTRRSDPDRYRGEPLDLAAVACPGRVTTTSPHHRRTCGACGGAGRPVGR